MTSQLGIQCGTPKTLPEFRTLLGFHFIFNMDESDRYEPLIPASPRFLRTARRKACRKCVGAKTACDLGKPKCKRCRDRGTSCEYPTHVKSRSAASAENQHATVNVCPLSTISYAISPDSTLPEGLVRSTGNISHAPSYPITDNGPIRPDTTAGLDFHQIDLVPMTDAEEIRDRWLRPYISSSTGQEPKQLNAHTIQYLTCVLKSYLRNLLNSKAPPFVHSMQQMGTCPPVLAYCFTLVRTWLTRIPGCEPLILRTMREEMRNIENQVCWHLIIRCISA